MKRKPPVRVVGVMCCCLSVCGSGSRSAGGQGAEPREYQRRDVVLTLTRAEMAFASDEYGDEPHDGVQLHSVGGILGGESTFWLLRSGLQEYDLGGHLMGVIPFPEPNKHGRVETYLATSEGIYVLQNHGWNWSSTKPNWTRLSYQLYSFSDSRWLGPIGIPDVAEMAHPNAWIWMTVRGGEVLALDRNRGVGVPLSSRGRHCDPVVIGEILDLGVKRVPIDVAANGSGFTLVGKGGRDHQDKDRGVVIDYLDYEVVNDEGRAVGTLRCEPHPKTKERMMREDLPPLSWAVLGDGTVLQLEIAVFGDPDDAIRVIRWTL